MRPLPEVSSATRKPPWSLPQVAADWASSKRATSAAHTQRRVSSGEKNALKVNGGANGPSLQASSSSEVTPTEGALSGV